MKPLPRSKAFGSLAILFLCLGGASLLLTAACNTTGPGQNFSSPGIQKQFLKSLRPPADETSRLLKNASLLRMLGRSHLALKELEEAYQREPGNLKIVDALASCYEELGDYQRAQDLYLEALKREPHHPAVTNNLCYSYYQAGKWQKAEACFREALKRDPGNTKARNNLGLLLARQGRQAEALMVWQQAEGEAAARQRLNQALAALGLPAEKTLTAAPQALKATPASPTAAVSQPKPQPLVTPVPVAAVPQAPANPAPQVLPVTPAAPTPAPMVAAASKPAAANVPEATPAPASLPAPKPAAVPAAEPAKSTRPPQAMASKPDEPLSLPPKPQVATPAKPEKQAAAFAKSPAPAATAAPPAASPTPTAPPQPETVEAPSIPNQVQEAHLTSQELLNTRLEVLNGNGRKGIARKHRQWLEMEGYTVTAHGNFRDFGQKRTTIAYRPDAGRVARHLARECYPQAELKETVPLGGEVAVRVILGKEQLTWEAKVSARLAVLHAKAAEALTAQAADAKPGPAKAAQASASPHPEPAPAAAAPATYTGPPVSLTAEELSQTRVAIRNGNGLPDMARFCRSQLDLNGFNIVEIKNHIDFGMEQTVIFHRPGFERVAQALAGKFFPQARLEIGEKLPDTMDVKIILGKDLAVRPEVLAHLAP